MTALGDDATVPKINVTSDVSCDMAHGWWERGQKPFRSLKNHILYYYALRHWCNAIGVMRQTPLAVHIRYQRFKITIPSKYWG